MKKLTCFSYSLAISLLLVQNVLWASSERSIDPVTQEIIDDFIQNTYLPLSQVPGVAVALVKNDGEILYSTGFGPADKEKNIPNENSTQFMIGSISKSFTAILATKILHEKFPEMGESVLDQPINKLLPDANFILSDRYRSEQVTFRDLITHRVCIYLSELASVAEAFDTSEEVLYRTRYNPQTCEFRSTFAYDNQMITMAGVLAARVINKSFEDAMQEFWNELGMSNTTFIKVTDDFEQMPYRAKPYYAKDGDIHPINTELIKRFRLTPGASGIASTADDMIKFVRFHLNGGRNLNGKQVIPQEVMKWLETPGNIFPGGYMFKKTDGESPIISQFAYGVGVVLTSYNDWKYHQHGGYSMPYGNLMSMYPDHKVGIFSTMNYSPFQTSPMFLHSFIYEVLKGNNAEYAREKAMKILKQLNEEEEKEETKRIAQFEATLKTFTKNARPQARVNLVGKYGSANTGDLEISERFNEERNQSELYLDYGKWYKGWLVNEDGGPVYKVDWTTDVYQDEYANQFGSVEHVVLNGDTVVVVGAGGYTGIFKLNFRSDDLPVVPWDQESCGPESTLL